MKIILCAILQCCFLLLFSSSDSMGEHEIGDGNIYQEGSMDNDKGHESQNRISKRSTSNIVNIRMFNEKSPPGTFYNVYVDSTMTRLIIEITVQSGLPFAVLKKPSGLPGPHQKINRTANSGPVTAIFDIAISSTTDYGKWTLNKIDPSIWSVTIRGESTLDFTYQFLQGSLMPKPIHDDPVQGETYKTTLTVVESSKTSVNVKIVKLYLIESSNETNTYYPKVKGSGKYEVSKLRMLYKDFMIGIEGEDKNGHTYQRIAFIKPIAFILSVPSFDASSTQKLYEHAKIDIPFTITNKLSKEQDYDIRIRDTQGLAQQPAILSATIKPGQNFTGTFALDGGLQGVQTTVTITAIPYHSNYTGPSLVRTFTVRSNKTTTTSTSTSTTTATTYPTSTSRSMTTFSTLNSSSPIESTNSKSTVAAQGSDKQTTGDTKRMGMLNHVTTDASSSSETAKNKANEAAMKNENTKKSFSTEELFGATSIAGMSVGVLIGVAALVTMGLVLRKSNKKKKVAPKNDQNTNYSILDQDITWT